MLCFIAKKTYIFMFIPSQWIQNDPDWYFCTFVYLISIYTTISKENSKNVSEKTLIFKMCVKNGSCSYLNPEWSGLKYFIFFCWYDIQIHIFIQYFIFEDQMKPFTVLLSYNLLIMYLCNIYIFLDSGTRLTLLPIFNFLPFYIMNTIPYE